jgi:hypothetical protein
MKGFGADKTIVLRYIQIKNITIEKYFGFLLSLLACQQMIPLPLN